MSYILFNYSHSKLALSKWALTEIHKVGYLQFWLEEIFLEPKFLIIWNLKASNHNVSIINEEKRKEFGIYIRIIRNFITNINISQKGASLINISVLILAVTKNNIFSCSFSSPFKTLCLLISTISSPSVKLLLRTVLMQTISLNKYSVIE